MPHRSVYFKLFAASQCPLETHFVFWGGGKDIADARQHEDGKRIVNHWLVVHRQQLLRGAESNGVEAGAGAAGQNNAFHEQTPKRSRLFVGSDPNALRCCSSVSVCERPWLKGL